MVVRQRDAHAWVEIHDAARGWIRVDPTGAVAPERVSLGIDTVMPRRSALPDLARAAFEGALLVRLREGVDALAYTWNQWVLGYSAQAQRRLFERLGFEDIDYGDLVIGLTAALGAATVLLGLLLLRGTRPRGDPAQAAWRRFSARLARVGLGRLPSEAPNAYAKRVASARADLAAEVLAITGLYTAIRYAPGPADPRPLQDRVRRFRPRLS